MTSLGVDLKLARQNQKVSLETIARDTRISLRYLQDIEEGRYRDLPGGMYNRAFLRAYCQYLHLDVKGFLQRYEKETDPAREKTLAARERVSRPLATPITIHPLIMWTLMLVASIVGLYFSRDWISSVFSSYFARSPVSQLPLTVQPHSPAPKSPAPTSTPQPAAASTFSPQDAPAQQAPLPTLPVDPLSPPSATLRIRMEVLQQCWMSIETDDRNAIVKLLEPGDDQMFDARERFYLILGNAGGVRLMINGARAKPLGRSGEVVKVLISQQTLQDLIDKSAP